MACHASLIQVQEYVPLLPRDKTICTVVADIVIVQCILVFIGSGSILYCVWNPDVASMDYDKLARVMYLFDSSACGYNLTSSKNITNLQFSNDTEGYNVHPIAWKRPLIMVSTRLSAKTRMYVKMSLAFHLLWMVMAVITWVYAKNCNHVHSLKMVLAIFFYSCIFMLIFDTSMALVYIAHIKQSLSKGMVLRYSGWSSTIKLSNYEGFAGWLPILASICWMRGVLILMLNIYCCKIIKRIRRKIKRREINWKYENERYRLIPDAKPIYLADNALVYRSGIREANRY